MEQQVGSARVVNSTNMKSPDDCRLQKDEGVWPRFRGGYHMNHRIDGKLFAVGVVDITPRCLSSVYLFYDPDFGFLDPGHLCAIKEIEYIKMIADKYDPAFKYYYMGLYFQDCQKSVYKGTYKPSQVSCPVEHKFVYLSDEVRALITAEKRPKLYETAVTNRAKTGEKETQEGGLFDHTKIETAGWQGTYKRLSDEEAKQLVEKDY